MELNAPIDEIEIYSQTRLQDFINILKSENSPVYISKRDERDGEEIHHSVFLGNNSFATGLVEEYEDYNRTKLFGELEEKLQSQMRNKLRKIKTEMWIDEGVEHENFIRFYKPVISFLKSKRINFAIVGREDNDYPHLIGYHVDKRTEINPDFRYEHRKLLE